MPIVPPKTPEGLVDLMKSLTKEIIREKPADIYEFAANYFENLLLKRDGRLDKGYEQFTIYENLMAGTERYILPSNIKMKCAQSSRQKLENVKKSPSKNLKQFTSPDVAPVQSTTSAHQKKLKAIYVIQRQVRRYLAKKKASQVPNKEHIKIQSTVPTIKIESAAIIIQRTLRKFFILKSQTNSVKLHAEALNILQEENDNASDAGSYTSSSTVLMNDDGTESKKKDDKVTSSSESFKDEIVKTCNSGKNITKTVQLEQMEDSTVVDPLNCENSGHDTSRNAEKNKQDTSTTTTVLNIGSLSSGNSSIGSNWSQNLHENSNEYDSSENSSKYLETNKTQGTSCSSSCSSKQTVIDLRQKSSLESYEADSVRLGFDCEEKPPIRVNNSVAICQDTDEIIASAPTTFQIYKMFHQEKEDTEFSDSLNEIDRDSLENSKYTDCEDGEDDGDDSDSIDGGNSTKCKVLKISPLNEAPCIGADNLHETRRYSAESKRTITYQYDVIGRRQKSGQKGKKQNSSTAFIVPIENIVGNSSRTFEKTSNGRKEFVRSGKAAQGKICYRSKSIDNTSSLRSTFIQDFPHFNHSESVKNSDFTIISNTQNEDKNVLKKKRLKTFVPKTKLKITVFQKTQTQANKTNLQKTSFPLSSSKIKTNIPKVRRSGINSEISKKHEHQNEVVTSDIKQLNSKGEERNDSTKSNRENQKQTKEENGNAKEKKPFINQKHFENDVQKMSKSDKKETTLPCFNEIESLVPYKKSKAGYQLKTIKNLQKASNGMKVAEGLKHSSKREDLQKFSKIIEANKDDKRDSHRIQMTHNISEDNKDLRTPTRVDSLSLPKENSVNLGNQESLNGVIAEIGKISEKSNCPTYSSNYVSENQSESEIAKQNIFNDNKKPEKAVHINKNVAEAQSLNQNIFIEEDLSSKEPLLCHELTDRISQINVSVNSILIEESTETAKAEDKTPGKEIVNRISFETDPESDCDVTNQWNCSKEAEENAFSDDYVNEEGNKTFNQIQRKSDAFVNEEDNFKISTDENLNCNDLFEHEVAESSFDANYFQSINILEQNKNLIKSNHYDFEIVQEVPDDLFKDKETKNGNILKLNQFAKSRIVTKDNSLINKNVGCVNNNKRSPCVELNTEILQIDSSETIKEKRNQFKDENGLKILLKSAKENLHRKSQNSVLDNSSEKMNCEFQNVEETLISNSKLIVCPEGKTLEKDDHLKNEQICKKIGKGNSNIEEKANSTETSNEEELKKTSINFEEDSSSNQIQDHRKNDCVEDTPENKNPNDTNHLAISHKSKPRNNLEHTSTHLSATFSNSLSTVAQIKLNLEKFENQEQNDFRKKMPVASNSKNSLTKNKNNLCQSQAAAITIQKAFRKYNIRKQFSNEMRKLSIEKERKHKELSRIENSAENNLENMRNCENNKCTTNKFLASNQTSYNDTNDSKVLGIDRNNENIKINTNNNNDDNNADKKRCLHPENKEMIKEPLKSISELNKSDVIYDTSSKTNKMISSHHCEKPNRFSNDVGMLEELPDQAAQSIVDKSQSRINCISLSIDAPYNVESALSPNINSVSTPKVVKNSSTSSLFDYNLENIINPIPSDETVLATEQRNDDKVSESVDINENNNYEGSEKEETEMKVLTTSVKNDQARAKENLQRDDLESESAEASSSQIKFQINENSEKENFSKQKTDESLCSKAENFNNEKNLSEIKSFISENPYNDINKKAEIKQIESNDVPLSNSTIANENHGAIKVEVNDQNENDEIQKEKTKDTNNKENLILKSTSEKSNATILENLIEQQSDNALNEINLSPDSIPDSIKNTANVNITDQLKPNDSTKMSLEKDECLNNNEISVNEAYDSPSKITDENKNERSPDPKFNSPTSEVQPKLQSKELSNNVNLNSKETSEENFNQIAESAVVVSAVEQTQESNENNLITSLESTQNLVVELDESDTGNKSVSDNNVGRICKKNSEVDQIQNVFVSKNEAENSDKMDKTTTYKNYIQDSDDSKNSEAATTEPLVKESSTSSGETAQVIAILSDFINSEGTDFKSGVPYEVLEDVCIKKYVTLTTDSEGNESENFSGAVEIESSSNECSTQKLINQTHDSMVAIAEKMLQTEKMVERMQQRRESETKINICNSDSIEFITEQTTNQIFEEPVIVSMNKLERPNSAEGEDDVILIPQETSKEISAKIDGEIKQNRISNVADATKSLLKSVTIDDVVRYIDPSENGNTTTTSESSLCLDDDTSKNIRQKMMAYSMSEADSDFCETSNGLALDENLNVVPDDGKIGTALGQMTIETNSDSDITAVSAATKIQAGARGFLTRRRLRRASYGEISTSMQETSESKKASFGNDAINESLEKLIEEEAARKIQKAYRHYYRQLGVQSSPSTYLDSFDQKEIKQIGQTENFEDFSSSDKRMAQQIKAKTTEEQAKNSKRQNDHGELNFDGKLAARRQTLQRGDALRNDSVPDEDTGHTRQLNSSETLSSIKVTTDIKPTNLQSMVTATPPIDVEKSLSSSLPSSSQTISVIKSKTFGRMTWFALRQNSMPVQIDSEVFRVIPKHLRKRIRSADAEKKKRVLKF